MDQSRNPQPEAATPSSLPAAWPLYTPPTPDASASRSSRPWYERKEETTTLVPIAAPAEPVAPLPRPRRSALAGIGMMGLVAACAAFSFGFQAARANMPAPLTAQAAIAIPVGLEQVLLPPETPSIWVYDLPLVTSVEPNAPSSVGLATTLEPRSFDRYSAVQTLGNAARAARVCLPAASPGAPVVARVTFGPDGRVRQAVVTNKPFAGTPLGDCLSDLIGTAWMNAFDGSPVTIDETLMVR